MLRQDNEQLRMQNTQLLQALTTTAGSRQHPPPSSSTSLSEGDYPLVQYWQKGKYNDVIGKKKGVTQVDAADVPKITAASFHFAEDAMGTPPTLETVAAIKATAASVMHDLAKAALLHDSGWSTMGQNVKERFREAMEKEYPDLRLCHGHWKADRIGTQQYSSWKASHGDRYFKQNMNTTVAEQENSLPIDSNISPLGPTLLPKRVGMGNACQIAIN
ncbi:hypothetical protein FB45DRAFT_1017102 [Roridomyces roridus]|uniref:Transposase n=1 Tax=Roridomyces roridus TaxID=1738132 RepID=A0AAD7CHU5_9AGAR|nr:hypothetical protein FB45DRAFT_1017102 [Roridomyces roridus]